MRDTSPPVVDLARERRVRDHLGELRNLLNADPDLAARAQHWMEEQMGKGTLISVRLPEELLEELNAAVGAMQQDPRFRSFTVTRTQAIIEALYLGLPELHRRYGGEAAPIDPATAPTRPLDLGGRTVHSKGSVVSYGDAGGPTSPDDLVQVHRKRAPVKTVTTSTGKRIGSSRSKPPETVAGVKLRTWREQQGIQQGEAAARMGKKQGQWSRWEGGRAVPTAKDRPALEQLAGIDPEDWSTPNPELEG